MKRYTLCQPTDSSTTPRTPAQSMAFFCYLCIAILFGMVACTPEGGQKHPSPQWDAVQDTTHRLSTIEGGLQGPEAVQYDAEQDVYFISNFNGSAMAPDSNAFIARARPDGRIDSLKFMTGTRQYPFHSGRGMYIVGDTLFVCDLHGIHGFNKKTGRHLSYVDLTHFAPGFLNDITRGADGALYVTDSGNPLLYRIAGQKASIAVESLPHVNNGIIYDSLRHKLILAGWNGAQEFLRYDSATGTVDTAGHGAGGNYDGIEMLGRQFIVSSQADSSLQFIRDGSPVMAVKVAGRPADIGYDVRRHRVAVPYIALNRVDIWQLPAMEDDE